MIDIQPCRGCGRPLIHHRVANLAVRLEPTPLSGQEAVDYLLQGGRSLWKVDGGNVRPARVGEPGPIREHRCRTDARQSGCTATGAPRTPSPVPAPQPTPQRPPAGRTTRSSGPSAAPQGFRRPTDAKASSVRSAVSHRSENPTCSACGRPCQDGTYASIEVGELTIWAQHVESCEG